MSFYSPINNTVLSYLAGGIFLLLLTNSCNEPTTNQLIGRWQAVAVEENGRRLNINPEEVTIVFKEEGYIFTSTLNYREQGTYQVRKDNLVTRDTFNQATTVKAIEIVRLDKDSLHLQSDQRLIRMARQSQ